MESQMFIKSRKELIKELQGGDPVVRQNGPSGRKSIIRAGMLKSTGWLRMGDWGSSVYHDAANPLLGCP